MTKQPYKNSIKKFHLRTVTEKTPVSIQKKTQMMTEVQQLMTTVAILHLTHGLSNLHVMHDEHPLMKKPFAWDWDLLLSDDTEDLDCKPPAKKTTPQATFS